VKGQVQIYTGNGKGKTTAALGLALRAYGAGLNVLFAQFVKGMEYSEIRALQQLGGRIDYRIYGRECFIYKEPEPEDLQYAQKGFDEIRSILTINCQYDLVVLDELNIALYYNLIPLQEVIDLISGRPDHTEIVITGRYAPEELIAIADLVTEMKDIRHYFDAKGLQARKGIEY
jgi:cob(I)alamin adenosyltransferase